MFLKHRWWNRRQVNVDWTRLRDWFSAWRLTIWKRAVTSGLAKCCVPKEFLINPFVKVYLLSSGLVLATFDYQLIDILHAICVNSAHISLATAFNYRSIGIEMQKRGLQPTRRQLNIANPSSPGRCELIMNNIANVSHPRRKWWHFRVEAFPNGSDWLWSTCRTCLHNWPVGARTTRWSFHSYLTRTDIIRGC